MADNPITRKEKYLAKLTGSYTGNVPDPITRVEKYLYDLCQKGISGLTPEEIENAVNKYLKENPVQPGATTEQAQQIKQNTDDVASLKEDLSNKITKFYASSQGETHLADSDNGKIMDMMLYGKSEQKQYNGCQLIDFSKGIYIQNATGSILNDTITVTAKNPYSGIRFPISLKKVMGNKIILTAKKSSQSNLEATVSIRIVASTVNGKEYAPLSKTYDVSDNVTSIVAEVIINSNDTVLDIPNTVTVEGLQLQIGSKQLGWEPYTGGIPSPNPDYPQEIKSVVNPTVKLSNEDGTQFKAVTLPYTLNAIPVSSGGNVTIDGQQYIADYVDVERGKLVRCVLKFDPSLLSVRRKDDEKTLFTYDKFDNNNMYKKVHGEIIAECSHLKVTQNTAIGADEEFKNGVHVSFYATEDGQGNSNVIYICVPPVCGTTALEFLEWSNKNAFEIIYKLATHTEIDLTKEEIAALKALVTYYPTTNISVNSEQLDGYTVFNYPISMANGWNYVKQQIGDTRNYIYDMDARTQDTDLQAAEAYVNSEYAVALTELEV